MRGGIDLRVMRVEYVAYQGSVQGICSIPLGKLSDAVQLGSSWGARDPHCQFFFHPRLLDQNVEEPLEAAGGACTSGGHSADVGTEKEVRTEVGGRGFSGVGMSTGGPGCPGYGPNCCDTCMLSLSLAGVVQREA